VKGATSQSLCVAAAGNNSPKNTTAFECNDDVMAEIRLASDGAS